MAIDIDVVPWGFPFMEVFVVAAIGYVAGGLVYGRRVQASTAQGLMAHPHARQWMEFLSLIVDGTSFASSKGKSRGRAYSSTRRADVCARAVPSPQLDLLGMFLRDCL